MHDVPGDGKAVFLHENLAKCSFNIHKQITISYYFLLSSVNTRKRLKLALNLSY